jgi:hypothetical protein
MTENQITRGPSMNRTEIEQARTSRQIVLQAITTICEHNAYANRASVTRMSGLSQGVVDDHIKKLKADDIIRMDVPGFYYPVDQTVDRMVSVTGMPMGRMKVEIGDVLLILTPREWFDLARFTAGQLFTFAATTFKAVNKT